MGAATGTNVAAFGGAIYRAPLGTALPTDATTVLAAAYKRLGPVSQDGVSPERDTNVEKVKEWNGTTLAQLLTDESRAFTGVLYGVYDEDVLKFVYGEANVTVVAANTTTGTKVTVLDKGGKPDPCVIVLDLWYGAKKLRKVIAYADPVVTGEEPYQKGALTGYQVSIEAITDSAGVRVYEYGENDDKLAA